MRAITIKFNTQRLFLILGFVILMGGCYSEVVEDKTAGLNGGFEVSKNGLPVNWLMYTPNSVPDADFQIILDKEIFKDGKQSLKFDVKRCSSTGGWKSPGFTNEFFEAGRHEGERRYKLSFWVKNDGTEFVITAGGVSVKEGNMTILIKNHEQIDDWKFLEYEVHVPKDRWLRMQLNILQPGTFWIDDVRIERI